jgi:hypothetical protein
MHGNQLLPELVVLLFLQTEIDKTAANGKEAEDKQDL